VEARRARAAENALPPGSVAMLPPSRPDPLGCPPPSANAYASLASLDRMDRWPSGLGGVAVRGKESRRK